MRRVAITTTPESFERVAPAFRAVDLEPVSLPCIRIEPIGDNELDSLRRAAAAADLLVITSRRTVEILWPLGDMPPTPVAAVGTATSHAVSDAGGALAFVGAGGGGELVDLISASLRRARVVYLHARRADPALGASIAERAASVVAGAVYDTIPIAPARDPVDIVTFASPSAVEGWTISRALDLGVVAIGPTTCSALERAGHPPDLIADDPTFSALARSVAQHSRSTQ